MVLCSSSCIRISGNQQSGWWFQIFFIFTPKIGEDSHFDEHIFQRGWFNHQLGNVQRQLLFQWQRIPEGRPFWSCRNRGVLELDHRETKRVGSATRSLVIQSFQSGNPKVILRRSEISLLEEF